MGAVQANVKTIPEDVIWEGVRKKALGPRPEMEKS
jgi:hypothetical protein